MKKNKAASFLALAMSMSMTVSMAMNVNAQEKDLTELTWYSAWSGSTLDDAEWFTSILADELGVKMNAILGCGDESIMQTLLASGELTDICTLRTDTIYTDAAAGGMLLNLEDYKDKLPNLFEDPRYEAALNRTRSLTEDGGVYGAPLAVGDQSGIYLTPKLRWELYYQLGCPKMETEDDFLNVLKQMQELQPETPEGQKVYGIQLWNDWDSNGFIGWANGLWMNQTGYSGFASSGSLSEAKAEFDSEPVYLLDENSNYMGMLRFMFKANQMGLVDPESATQNYEQMSAKMNAGGGLYDGLGWFSYGNEEEETGFAPVWAGFMKSCINRPQPAGYTWYYGISSKCEHLEEALALLNWFYDDKNQDLIGNGPEGGIWEYNEDGIRVATEGYKSEKSDLQLEGGGTLRNVRDFWGSEKFNSSGYELGITNGTVAQTNRITHDPLFYVKEDSALEKQWKSVYGDEWDWSDLQKFAVNNDNVVQFGVLAMFVPAASEEINAKVAEISNIILPAQWQAIFAEDEAEFDAIIEQAREDAIALGVEDVLQSDLERYNKAVEIMKSYGL